MKTVLFISSNKMLGQGLSEAIRSKPELDFLWAASSIIRRPPSEWTSSMRMW